MFFKKTLFVFLLLASVRIGYAQDTVLLDKRIYYRGKACEHHDMNFANKEQFGRELINLSDTVKRVEWCNYCNKKRVSFGRTYTIKNDSVLIESFATMQYSWIYKKTAAGKYEVHRYEDGGIEYGISSRLIPVERRGPFVTVTADKADTLYIINYRQNEKHESFVYPQKKIDGKIYEAAKVDHAPLLLNNDSIPVIHLARTDYCFNEPILWVRSMSCVITKTGRIVNIKQDYGNFEEDWCPTYLMDLMRHIQNMGPLKPAMVNGKPVNVRWVIKIDMEREIPGLGK